MQKLLTFAFLFTATIAAYGQNSRPRVPFVDNGACPFECCTYRSWTVDKDTTVRTAMRDGASVAFRLKKGERVRGLTGTVITTQAGEVRTLKKTKLGNVTVNPGQTLYLLTYLGEGFHKIWYRGRIYEEETYDPEIFRQVREPRSVWWVKVRNSKGKIGWSREPEHFGNKDECGN